MFFDVTFRKQPSADEDGRPAEAPTMGDENVKSKGAVVSLPQHSYWFDFWVFVLFDLALLLVMYFMFP
uniref:Uncharacterized protein n=1 Tax=Myripristis murdjan TaxID=586833 RepID=A0A668AGY2_9TELE